MSTPDSDHFDARWEAFTQSSHMTNHWYWRPGWRLGRSFYTWHLTFGACEPLLELAGTVQAALAHRPGFSPVSGRWLHLTMQGLGFVGDIPESDVDQIVEQARTRLQHVPRFSLVIGPVDADAEGAGLEIRPWEPVEGVRAAVRAAIAGVWGSDRVPEAASGFRPHITAAYSSSDGPVAPVVAALAGLRSTPPVTVPVTHADLIELNRDEQVGRRAGSPGQGRPSTPANRLADRPGFPGRHTGVRPADPRSGLRRHRLARGPARPASARSRNPRRARAAPPRAAHAQGRTSRPPRRRPLRAAAVGSAPRFHAADPDPHRPGHGLPDRSDR